LPILVKRPKVLCVVGTRPEAIKMAPVIERLKESGRLECRVLVTAQHRNLLDTALGLFGIKADIDLDVMRPNQALNVLLSRLLEGMDDALVREEPAALLAQGDTTSVLAAAIASFHRRVPFGHVEAGLRTGSFTNPFPEEANRVLATRLAEWHFAPTQSARDNLLAEGLPDESIYVTGNTVIDALLEVAPRAEGPDLSFASGKRLILMTAHRRENFGAPMEAVFSAVRRLVERRSDVAVLYPVHPNPNVKAMAHRLLSGHPRIRLLDPLEYEPFVAVMKACHFVLTDSGGVQEEAPALGKPVLVMREETERPEAVECGAVKLVGTQSEHILDECEQLLDRPEVYRAMAQGVSPYGDGKAAARIVRVLESALAPASLGKSPQTVLAA
jgi:UDP-N-acetylglucosamine 2-epimerase (non-hydrolysing)